MGIDIFAEISKATRVLSMYRMSSEDQIKVVRILLDAGVEQCLQEQQRIREGNSAMIAKAQSVVVH